MKTPTEITNREAGMKSSPKPQITNREAGLVKTQVPTLPKPQGK